MRHALLTTLLGVSNLIGCQHTQSNKSLPAIIEHTTPSIKVKIQRAIETIYGGISPLLSNSVLFHPQSERYVLLQAIPCIAVTE